MIGQIAWKVIKKNFLLFFILLVVIGVFVLASLLPAQLQKIIVDQYINQQSVNGLLVWAIWYLVVLMLIGGLDVLRQILIVKFGATMTRSIRYKMATKLATLKTRYFSENAPGSITSRFTSDVDAIDHMFSDGLASMLIDVLKIVGIVISMFLFSMMLGVLTIVAIVIIFVLTRLIQRVMLKAHLKNRRMIGKVNNHLGETYTNQRMIKIFHAEDYMESRYDQYLDENFKAVEKVNFFDSVYPPLVVLMRGILITIVAITAAGLWGLSAISVGILAASIELLSSLFSPIESLGMELQNLQQSLAGIKRVNEFLSSPDEAPKKKYSVTDIIPNRAHIQLKFDHVSFAYEQDVTVIDDIDINVESREKATLIGRTGVGKTTLFKLVMGLLKPTNGTITLNGIDVYEIPDDIKYQIFGYVDQSFSAISGSVLEQMTLGHIYPEEHINQVIEAVGLTSTIQALPKGLQTTYAEAFFSQGEQQLLSIARAIISNPPILLLDEITASLDSLTEARVNQALMRASLSRTILSISHRLASIDAADKVIYIENGRVRKQGTRTEVLALPEFQKELELEKLWR
ncbi:MAG: ABC transporter ATP-binding protein [Bacilli bacterium]|jgi:ATP-binding cassette subfamily B protein|nr:ABC transporter ATP-binding protein [Acholeplasmataceae bacterium]